MSDLEARFEVDVDAQVEGVDPDRIEALARAALEAAGLDTAVLSVVLCDDETIQPLNRDWRDKDAPTDVLSFSQREGEGAFVDDPVLGDLVISVETAARQAIERGHSLDEELRILLVHGLLHLLGYDHEEPADEVEMSAREAEVLAALGHLGAGLLQAAQAASVYDT